MTRVLPNVRKLFTPDPGYTLFEADLAGADAQVVAWEAEDEDLKLAFKRGLKIHVKNARDMFPDKVKGWTDEAIKATDGPDGIYSNCKKGVHATNYGVTPRSIAQALGWLVSEAESFQRRWFTLHPGIKTKFHGRIKDDLAASRTITNPFGFRRVFFDRIDACFTEALAWKPQSTVALNTYLGAFSLEEKVPEAEILLQVHDSLVFQLPNALATRPETSERVREALEIVTPYSDPLIIQWGLASSTKSWGDMEKVNA